MRVYVETNFVLELVLGQEQTQSCEAILALAESGTIELVIPAFSILEPYQRIVRRKRERDDLQSKLEKERSEVARITSYRTPTNELAQLSSFLIASSERDSVQIQAVRGRLVNAARIIDLNSRVLRASATISERFGLSAEDAVVFESVRSDLAHAATLHDGLFLTRNIKDFRDPELVSVLRALGCETLFDFDGSYGRISSLTR